MLEKPLFRRSIYVHKSWILINLTKVLTLFTTIYIYIFVTYIKLQEIYFEYISSIYKNA